MDGFDQGWTFLSWLAIVRLQGRGSGGEPSRQQRVQVQWPDISGIRDRSDSRGGGNLWGPESQRVGQHHQRVGGLDAGEWFIKGSRMSHAIDAAGSGGPAPVTGGTTHATRGGGDPRSPHPPGRTRRAPARPTGNPFPPPR